MSSPAQPADEVSACLYRLHGREIKSLQVLGINALKSVTPRLDQLPGQAVTGSRVLDRTFELWTSDYIALVDLQRTGKVVWLNDAVPYSVGSEGVMPTMRLLLVDGSGIDLVEPSKTKRITLTLSHRGE